MDIEKITFTNEDGQNLEGHLEFPFNQTPHNFVIFAHCFTCNKNLRAIRNISNALTNAGFAVLRFDFTGLGASEGDFSDTNFSGNVADLIAAADFLKDDYRAPTMIIGHSLGGAAAIYAAEKISSIQTVATIAAPSDPRHVLNLMKDSKDEIMEKGQATVNLGGRDFTIKKQFIDDLNSTPMSEVVRRLKRAIIIFHSPQDNTVGIENAEAIYNAARHPKSFVSLDGADHLLSNKEDSRYVGKVIAGWADRYLPIPRNEEVKSKNEVAASLNGDDLFTTRLKLGRHSFTADEPAEVGGRNYGPSPYNLLAGGLAACTAMTIQMYARRKKWKVENVNVHITHSKDYAKDCANCEDPSARLDHFNREVALKGDLSVEQKEKLIEIANKCPVHRTLTGDVEVTTNMQE
jgi:putative redox protein